MMIRMKGAISSKFFGANALEKKGWGKEVKGITF